MFLPAIIALISASRVSTLRDFVVRELHTVCMIKAILLADRTWVYKFVFITLFELACVDNTSNIQWSTRLCCQELNTMLICLPVPIKLETIKFNLLTFIPSCSANQSCLLRAITPLISASQPIWLSGTKTKMPVYTIWFCTFVHIKLFEIGKLNFN